MPVGIEKEMFSVPEEARPTTEQLKALDGKVFTNADIAHEKKRCKNCCRDVEINPRGRFIRHTHGIRRHGGGRCIGSGWPWKMQP